MFKEQSVETFWVKLYIAGPIEVAKQVLRQRASEGGLCVTIEPTYFIYKYGEEAGYVVGLVNYPRFPESPERLTDKARNLLYLLLEETHQGSGMLMTPETTILIDRRQNG